MKRGIKTNPISQRDPLPLLKFLDPQLVITSPPSQELKRGRGWETEIHKRVTQRSLKAGNHCYAPRWKIGAFCFFLSVIVFLSFCYSFMPPKSKNWGHSVYCPSFCHSVNLSDAFTFPWVLTYLTLWSWPWSLTYFLKTLTLPITFEQWMLELWYFT